jgi:hypothetical protein
MELDRNCFGDRIYVIGVEASGHDPPRSLARTTTSVANVPSAASACFIAFLSAFHRAATSAWANSRAPRIPIDVTASARLHALPLRRETRRDLRA